MKTEGREKYTEKQRGLRREASRGTQSQTHGWPQTGIVGSLGPCARGCAYVPERLSGDSILSFLGFHKEGREGHRFYLTT